MTFSSYWKEVAIVLAALFAIGSLLSDARSKHTGKFTIWGKAFLVLTILSMVGGLYAQWMENAAEEKRNMNAQAAILNLLQRTEKSVYDLSRLLQPIDNPRVTLLLKPDCVGDLLKAFCDSVRLQGRRSRLPPHSSTLLTSENWSTWPTALFMGVVRIHFFKGADAADRFINSQCGICESAADLIIDVNVLPGGRGHKKDVMSVAYMTGTEEVDLIASNDAVTPQVKTDKILSVLDILGSTMVLTASNTMFASLKPTAVFIHTAHGQRVNAEGLQLVKTGGTEIFVYRFDSGKEQRSPNHLP